MTTTDIIFLRVADNDTKLKRFTNGVHTHFCRGHNIMIHVANEAAVRYIDELLWRMPVDGFMPHTVNYKPCDDPIVITTSSENLNRAAILFNLKAQAHQLIDQYRVIYDLFDESTPDKLLLSQQRQQSYPYSRIL